MWLLLPIASVELCHFPPLPSSWIALEYEKQYKHLLEIGTTGCQDIIRIPEEGLGSCWYEFEAFPMHAIHRVEKGVE